MSTAAAPESTLVDPWLKEIWSSIWAKPEFSMVPLDYQAVPLHPYQGTPLPAHGFRIVFCGIPSDYGTSFLLHLLETPVHLVAVVCSTRWQRTHPLTDLLARIAGHIGRPVEVVANVNADPFRNCLRAYAPDLVVMASFDQIIGAETLVVPRLGWINIHPSLLPRHRGPEPIYWTIRSGDREAGITLHWTVQKIDAGPILSQRAVPVLAADTAGTLTRRLVTAGLSALDDTLAGLASGGLVAVEQDARRGSYEPPVQVSELDWDQPYRAIERLVRAGSPDQPPRFAVDGVSRYVLGIRRVRARQDEPPGVLRNLDGHVLAATRDALVEVAWRPFGHTHAVRPLRRQQFP